jgi:ligand-binding sensor protein
MNQKRCEVCRTSDCMGGQYVRKTEKTQAWVCRVCLLAETSDIVQGGISNGSILIHSVKANKTAECVYYCKVKRKTKHLRCKERK